MDKSPEQVPPDIGEAHAALRRSIAQARELAEESEQLIRRQRRARGQ